MQSIASISDNNSIRHEQAAMKWLRHQLAAVQYWEEGKYRKSADNYWQAFKILQSYPTHEARYHMLHGYTSILRDGGHFVVSDDDMDNLRNIFKNKHEQRLYRVEAGFTLGVIHYACSERDKCEGVYRYAISIGEKKPNRKHETMEAARVIVYEMKDGAFTQQKRTMKELMQRVIKDSRDNLDAMRGAETTLSAEQQPVIRTHLMPIGHGGTTLSSTEIQNLINVGGDHCDYCKRKDMKLFKCSKCNRGFYCSRDCQVKQWTENEHKMHCRKEGEFKPNDIVQIARLKNKPELNHIIVRLVGPDKADEGRYEIKMEGGYRSLSVSAKNLNQLRPYDCRK